MNSVIEKAFSNFNVDGEKIPIKFIEYEGKSSTYLTYQSIGNSPSLIEDDEITASVEHFDIDIYSKNNYLNVLKEAKKIMKEAGFMWVEDSQDMYERDTGYYHKTVEFAIEREV